MVFISSVLRKFDKFRYGKFVDSVRVYVRGGAGGTGLPKYGGIGGKGGNVIVTAKEGQKLKNLTRANPLKRFIAGNGGNSTKNCLLGVPGADIEIPVPIGVTVIDDFGRVLGELNTDGSSVTVAEGGLGGNPASQFNGKRAEPLSVKLQLKLIADVGLVGFPNAGKSTLLRAISRARPKVASYPFTTIQPNIGVLEYSDKRQITMADLPGLIEGAYRNLGMGHSFLKHVERTKLLLLMADIEGFQLGPQYPDRSCLDTVILLNKELELYKEDLLNKPALLVINKMDLEGSQYKYDKIKDQLRHLEDVVSDYSEDIRPERVLEFTDVIAISADKNPDDVNRLKHRLREVLDFHAALEEGDREIEVTSQLYKQMSPIGPQML